MQLFYSSNGLSNTIHKTDSITLFVYMKKTTTLFILVSIVSVNLFAQSRKKILFIGNSYTYGNSLPQALANICKDNQDTINVDSYAQGGYYLGNHVQDSQALAKIKRPDWDYIILQDQSLAYAYYTFINSIPYAIVLDSLRKTYSPCGQTVFYITWGRKNGDQYWCPESECGKDTLIVRNYYQMDSAIQLNYMTVVDSLKALASPVGAVWRYIRRNYPNIELFQPDESHPSEAGTYAAACCFYTAIFKKNPLTITNKFTLNAADAANIRSAVKAVMFDSLLNWGIGTQFKSTLAANNVVTFQNLTRGATSYQWNFGDGNTSTDENPVHTYAINGSYTVKLITHYCNSIDSSSKVVVANTRISTGFQNSLDANNIQAYPNPVTSQLVLSTDKVDYIQLVNAIGQIYTLPYNIAANNIIVDLSAFPAGVYMLLLSQQNSVFTHKIVKQ